MTVYAYDEARCVLVAAWDTGIGLTASTIAKLPHASDRDEVLRLAAALTTLSRVVWRTYTHPVSAAESVELDSEGWRRQGERDAFAGVLANIRQPNLLQNGYMVQSYIMVEEAAHRVGRTLHNIGNQTICDLVVDD
ncbi:hypothetical protein [Kutzneria albida]|uniref:Uncharacterized protein n=1 Tax=Kutzneria albida DSM 43870 TaxID=1449976 RepID=W5WD59_9PSEU|nr:hypothetical protein [Kutzneria albida]AHH98670.1 hypothetical protein KALB_5308 [Kutzneria albida DSM 43870]